MFIDSKRTFLPNLTFPSAYMFYTELTEKLLKELTIVTRQFNSQGFELHENFGAARLAG